jgi:hypothetical protein
MSQREGGIAMPVWVQTGRLSVLFLAAGEAGGCHGLPRPGGPAIGGGDPCYHRPTQVSAGTR